MENKNKIQTFLLLEQHIHGAYGVNYSTATTEDVVQLSKKLYEHGIGGVFPTLVTDSVENIKRQIEVIKKASTQIGEKATKIFGIHLEGVFINPIKKGTHDPQYFLPLTVEEYKKIEDDFIKIVTLAPELDKGLIDYIADKGVKIQAGHCVGGDLSKVNGVTHTFNAMTGISHRGDSTALSALTDDNLYCEIIADGIHVSDKAIELLRRTKPDNKVIIVSDALPITGSNIREADFAGHKIYYDGVKATGADGVIAGSTTLIDKSIQLLGQKGMMKEQYVLNPYEYHGIKPFGEIIWDEHWNITKIAS